MIGIGIFRIAICRNRTFIAYILNGRIACTADDTAYVIGAFEGRSIIDGLCVVRKCKINITIFLYALNTTDDGIIFCVTYQTTDITLRPSNFA